MPGHGQKQAANAALPFPWRSFKTLEAGVEVDFKQWKQNCACTQHSPRTRGVYATALQLLLLLLTTDQGDCLRSCLDFSGDFRSARHHLQPLPLTKDSSGARAIVSLKRQREDGAAEAQLTSSGASGSGSDQQRAARPAKAVGAGKYKPNVPRFPHPLR